MRPSVSLGNLRGWYTLRACAEVKSAGAGSLSKGMGDECRPSLIALS